VTASQYTYSTEKCALGITTSLPLYKNISCSSHSHNSAPLQSREMYSLSRNVFTLKKCIHSLSHYIGNGPKPHIVRIIVLASNIWTL